MYRLGHDCFFSTVWSSKQTPSHQLALSVILKTSILMHLSMTAHSAWHKESRAPSLTEHCEGTSLQTLKVAAQKGFQSHTPLPSSHFDIQLSVICLKIQVTHKVLQHTNRSFYLIAFSLPLVHLHHLDHQFCLWVSKWEQGGEGGCVPN